MKSDNASSHGATMVCDIILCRAWGCTRNRFHWHTAAAPVNEALQACMFCVTIAWLMTMQLQSESYKQIRAHTP